MGFIDHINGIKDDNRINNLRDVTRSQNHQNRKLAKHNTSGVIGVYWRSDTNKWAAQINSNNKRLVLGCYTNKQDAINARRLAEKNLGFHSNHGRIQ